MSLSTSEDSKIYVVSAQDIGVSVNNYLPRLILLLFHYFKVKITKEGNSLEKQSTSALRSLRISECIIVHKMVKSCN